MAALSQVRVSVAMSVYNGAASLQRTLEGLSAQAEEDIEFLVVDDGSTDATASLLAAWAAGEPRARILTQANIGLTRSLARACAEARGDYIARQDAGDRSLPGRFRAQADFLDAHPEAVMTACVVRFLGPGDELLHTISRAGEELDAGVRQLDLEALRGPPHHGASMFRRGAYLQAGGYRLPFVVAQDIDLWARLAEQGVCIGTGAVAYEARMEAGSISSRRRDEQFRLGQLAIDCARARRSGGDEGGLLAAFSPGEASKARGPGAGERARFHYFIGSCLRDSDAAAAGRYFRMALRDNPFHLKALWRILAG